MVCEEAFSNGNTRFLPVTWYLVPYNVIPSSTETWKGEVGTQLTMSHFTQISLRSLFLVLLFPQNHCAVLVLVLVSFVVSLCFSQFLEWYLREQPELMWDNVVWGETDWVNNNSAKILISLSDHTQKPPYQLRSISTRTVTDTASEGCKYWATTQEQDKDL